ncbi:hypothetical protein [Comamonas sp. 26]|uniref:hypothetical protein n=1 Tax=Comamonas sp. 26 TaxID=2035201 RepID=UPI000C18E8A1|nr:hypothetical protein [Comamonas sp. 26]PIG09623.1 hypothetical protein CLU84_2553 [Comamonas sp. 26]
METFELRISALIKHLERSKPCADWKSAHELVKSKWIEVCSEVGMPQGYLEEISQTELVPEPDLDTSPAGNFLLNGEDEPLVCTYIQANGGIVIQRMEGASAMEILMNLPPDLSPATQLQS